MRVPRRSYQRRYCGSTTRAEFLLLLLRGGQQSDSLAGGAQNIFGVVRGP